MTGECTYTAFGVKKVEKERRRHAQGGPTTFSNSINTNSVGEELKEIAGGPGRFNVLKGTRSVAI
jgi:hypothetical protein